MIYITQSDFLSNLSNTTIKCSCQLKEKRAKVILVPAGRFGLRTPALLTVCGLRDYRQQSCLSSSATRNPTSHELLEAER